MRPVQLSCVSEPQFPHGHKVYRGKIFTPVREHLPVECYLVLLFVLPVSLFMGSVCQAGLVLFTIIESMQKVDKSSLVAEEAGKAADPRGMWQRLASEGLTTNARGHLRHAWEVPASTFLKHYCEPIISILALEPNC